MHFVNCNPIFAVMVMQALPWSHFLGLVGLVADVEKKQQPRATESPEFQREFISWFQLVGLS
jgi:hypothetical protein